MSNTPKNEKNIVTVVCPQTIKPQISSDKLPLCKKPIQIIPLLRRLEVDLTSKEKDCNASLEKQYKIKLKKLWLPTETDCASLVSTSSKTLSKPVLKGKSWFSAKQVVVPKKILHQTLLQSSQSFQQDLMGSKNKSKKIRIFPTTSQKTIFKNWFGLYRWYYNRTIDYCEEYNIY